MGGNKKQNGRQTTNYNNFLLLSMCRGSAKRSFVAVAPHSARPYSRDLACWQGARARFLTPPQRRTKSPNAPHSPLLFVMPGVGIEPTWSFDPRILSPLRIPFRHPGNYYLEVRAGIGHGSLSLFFAFGSKSLSVRDPASALRPPQEARLRLSIPAT